MSDELGPSPSTAEPGQAVSVGRGLSWLSRMPSLSGSLLCGLIVGLAVLLNWPAEYGNYAIRAIGTASRHSEGIEIGGLAPPVKLVMGGWPFTFYIANTFEATPPAIHFSWPRLAGNLLIFACITLFFWKYEQRSQRSMRASGSHARTFRQRFSVSDLVLLVTLVGLCLGYWQSQKHYTMSQSRTLDARAGKMLSGTLSVRMPGWLSKQQAMLNTRPLLRVRELELHEPDDEMLAYALTFQTLQSLRIGGGSYDLKLLEGLRKLPVLCDLRVSGRQLNPAAIASIASCKQLQSLNLMRTNITAAGVHALGELPHLQVLNLIHTDVWLAELGRPPIADNLSILFLPHRDHGTAEELVLEDWSKLTRLEIAEYDTLSNSTPIKVTLRRLPKLAKLGLDQLQLFDLTIDEVPELQTIEAVAHQLTDRVRKSDPEPTVVSLNNLAISNSAVTEQLAINVADLETIDIQSKHPVSLRLYHRTVQDSSSEPTTNRYARHYQKLLDQLGRCSAPMTLDLSGLNLHEVDLNQFVKIQGLKKLTMFLRFDIPQLNILSKLGVRELALRGSIMGEQLSEIVADMADLERLTIDKTPFDQVAIEGSKLKEIRFANPSFDPYRFLIVSNRSAPAPPSSFAHIVDVPELVTEATFTQRLSKVRIENAPALTQLRFFAPLPAGSVVRGLRDLKCFAGGGRELRDEHFDAIVGCQQLQTLCLVNSGVSSNRLKEIDGLQQLTCLSLSGSSVTDEVLASWKSLKKLHTLRLRRTQVTPKGLGLIPQLFPDLERLTIDTPIDETTLDELIKIKALIDLGLQKSKLSAGALKKLQTLTELIQLDLSRCTLDATETANLEKQFVGNTKRLVLTDAQLMPSTSQPPETGESALQRTDKNESRDLRVRFLSGRQGSVRFSQVPPEWVEILLDQDEVWDEPFFDESNGAGR